jgi:hypothetical protein
VTTVRRYPKRWRTRNEREPGRADYQGLYKGNFPGFGLKSES